MSVKDKACNILNNVFLKDVENKKNEIKLQKELNTYFPISPDLKKKHQEEVVNVLIKDYGESTVSEKEYKTLLKKVFPKDHERVSLIFKIRSALESYPVFKKALLRYFTTDVSDIRDLKGLNKDLEQMVSIRKNNFGKEERHINLDALPVSKLRKFFHQTYDSVHLDGKKLLGGFFGSLRVSWGTPRHLAYKDKTGSISFMYNAATNFANDVQSVLKDISWYNN